MDITIKHSALSPIELVLYKLIGSKLLSSILDLLQYLLVCPQDSSEYPRINIALVQCIKDHRVQNEICWIWTTYIVDRSQAK